MARACCPWAFCRPGGHSGIDLSAFSAFVFDPEEDFNDVAWLAQEIVLAVTSDGRHLEISASETRIVCGASMPQPPEASFTWAPQAPAPDEPIQFTDSSTENPTFWSWTFGDGSTSSLENPEHAFDSPGALLGDPCRRQRAGREQYEPGDRSRRTDDRGRCDLLRWLRVRGHDRLGSLEVRPARVRSSCGILGAGRSSFF